MSQRDFTGSKRQEIIPGSCTRSRGFARLSASTAVGLVVTALFTSACRDGTTDPERVNNSPVATGTIPAQTVDVGETATVDLSDYLNDPDGDALTYSAQTSDAGVATASVSGSNAVVTGVAKGEAAIAVTATDPTGLSARQSFRVEVPNRAPEAVGNIADLELLGGDTVTIDVSGHFTDPDGDALTFEAITSDEDVATASVQGATVTVVAVSDGTASLTVTASDPGGLSVEQGFSATVDRPGDPMVEFLTGPVTVLEGERVVVELEARPAPESALEVGYTIGGDDDPRTDDADETDHDAGTGGTIRFEAGSGRATLEITVRDDGEVDPTREVLGVSLDTPAEGAGYRLGSSTVALATIEEGVCDRTPRVRDELMAITAVDRCHAMAGSHLAAIAALDLRGPAPQGSNVASDLRGAEGARSRGCSPRERSALRGQSSGLPVPELTECSPVAQTRMAPAPPPSSASTGTGEALTELRAGDFLELTELKELWLPDNHLTELPAGIFSGLTELRVLIMDRNRLKKLPGGLLSGLPRLEVFAVADNELTRLPPDLFSGLSRLERVWLYRNELHELPAGLFADLDNLEELHLGDNRLDALPAGIFAGPGRLRILTLYRNRLAELDAAVFSELGDLEQLYLSDNRLTELPSGVFSNLGGLEILPLHENRLTGLPPDVFANLGSLEVLYLDDNRLQGLPNGLFDGLPGLVTLRLGGNRIAEIESGTFAGLSGLQWLHLHQNRLVLLEPGVFSGLSGLQGLALEENRIRDLGPGVFDGLSRLQILILRDNQLGALESGVFTGLPALVELWIYRNQITELSEDVLVDLPLLRKLIMWDNRLTELPPGVFSGLTRLEELSLAENQLAKLPEGIFSGLAALKSLSVAHNHLAELSDGVFAGLSELGYLNLGFNPGTPFPLDVRLERTDTPDLAAPGPARVVLSLAEAAPFPMTIPLAVEGGTLSTDKATIERGRATSEEFTVTMNSGSQTGTAVVMGPAPLILEPMIGVHLVAADTLVLFTTSGDASDGEPDMAARLEEPAPGTGGLAPVNAGRGLAGGQAALEGQSLWDGRWHPNRAWDSPNVTHMKQRTE